MCGDLLTRAQKNPKLLNGDGRKKRKELFFLSFSRKRESSLRHLLWTPAFAGVTIRETSYKFTKIRHISTRPQWIRS